MAEKNELCESFEGLPVQDSLIDYDLKLVRSEPFRQYKWDSVVIIEREPLTTETYPLSTKEVLTVVDYYGCTDILKKIIISNHQKVNLQGLQEGKLGSKVKSIELHIPSDLSHHKGLKGIWKQRAKKNLRWGALFTLLHELGHVMMYDHTYKCGDIEEKCDEFAMNEIEKFTKSLIKGCD